MPTPSTSLPPAALHLQTIAAHLTQLAAIPNISREEMGLGSRGHSISISIKRELAALRSMSGPETAIAAVVLDIHTANEAYFATLMGVDVDVPDLTTLANRVFSAASFVAMRPTSQRSQLISIREFVNLKGKWTSQAERLVRRLAPKIPGAMKVPMKNGTRPVWRIPANAAMPERSRRRARRAEFRPKYHCGLCGDEAPATASVNSKCPRLGCRGYFEPVPQPADLRQMKPK